MSSDLGRCCTISHVVIGRHILTCTSSTHHTDAEPSIRVAASERSMASVDCQGAIMSQTRGTAHTPRGTERVCACGRRLSASNTGKRCAACERKFKEGLGKPSKKPARQDEGYGKRTGLSYARKAVGLTQEQLAEMIHVDRSTVFHWEAGDHRPQPYLWPKLAKVIEISRDRIMDLLIRENEPEIDAQESIRASHIRHPMDGRLMAKIDGSVFLSGPGNEPTWLPTFYIDVYPVTNAEYARFIAATGHTPPQHWTDERTPEHLSDHPVVLVTWNDAAAYAEWAGKSLPSGPQWEKAARGTRGTVYPWGDQPTPAKCNVRENGVGSTTTVDCYKSGVSPYGVFDLCGNIWEWCSTETRPSRHELKGGAWTSPFLRATPSSFNDAAASMCDDDTGFRCVVTAETLDR
jgi:DNA-binding XRE family transcriptional regulator